MSEADGTTGPEEEATRALRRKRINFRPKPVLTPEKRASREILNRQILEALLELPVEDLRSVVVELEKVADEPDRYKLVTGDDGLPKAVEKSQLPGEESEKGG